MRGKNIVWLALIALVASVLLSGVSYAQEGGTIYVNPPLVTGYLTGDSFDVDIDIADAENIYAWEFSLSFPKFLTVLAAIDIVEGDFLKAAQGPEGTYMAKSINAFEGKVSAAGTLKGDVDGASGAGTLATVRFSVLEPAGEYPLDLFDTHLWMRIFNMLIEVPHDAVDGTFLGPVLDFVKVPGEDAFPTRMIKAGQTRKLKCTVRNYGYAPVYARVRYIMAEEGGGSHELYSGQHMYTSVPRAPETYYVNEFTLWRQQWATVGDEPWLDAVDGSYIEGTVHCQWIGIFGFEDITLGPADIIGSVTIEGYCQADSGDMDFDLYDWNTGAWIDSLWGGGIMGWHTTRWVDPVTSNIVPALLTGAGFNNFQVVLHCYNPGTFGRMDALRLRVEFVGMEPPYVPGITVMPGEERTTEWAIWDLYDFDVGMYVTTIIVEYKQETPDPRFPQYWATAETIHTCTWWCYP